MLMLAIHSLVPWEDQLRSHPVYVQSAISAAQVCILIPSKLENDLTNIPKIWVQLHDDPSLVKKYSPSGRLYIETNLFYHRP